MRVRAALLVFALTSVVLAGCATPAPAATPTPPPKGVAHVIVQDTGKTPVTAEILWEAASGAGMGSQVVQLLPGERQQRDFEAPEPGLFVVDVHFYEALVVPSDGPWQMSQPWDSARCPEWTAAFEYDNSISPISWRSSSGCDA